MRFTQAHLSCLSVSLCMHPSPPQQSTRWREGPTQPRPLPEGVAVPLPAPSHSLRWALPVPHAPLVLGAQQSMCYSRYGLPRAEAHKAAGCRAEEMVRCL